MSDPRSCPKCGRAVIKISWSSLRTHEECKQRGHLVRSKRGALLANKRGFFAGTVTDRVVRAWLKDDPASNPGVMADMVSAMVDTERSAINDSNDERGVMAWRDSNDRATLVDQCRKAVTLIEPDLMKYVVPYDFWADDNFTSKIKLTNPQTGQPEEITLRGAMDIVVRTGPDQWWVWDVKHTLDNNYWRKTVGQLGFYDLIMLFRNGVPTVGTGLLQPLCTPRVKHYTPTDQSRTELLQRINAMARDIWNSNFPMVEGTDLCGWCEVKHACPKFAPTRDADGRKRGSLGSSGPLGVSLS